VELPHKISSLSDGVIPGLSERGSWHSSSFAFSMDDISASADFGESIAAAMGSASSFLPKVKVWLVDGNDELRRLAADLLSLQAGIECARHFSSPDALLSELASKPGPDVILLDVQIGDRNGLDAVRPIKSLTRSTRVLMFTTFYNRDWRERAFSAGASDYLLKSSPLKNLAARIRCPAGDPVSGSYVRRRAGQAAARPLQSHLTSSITDHSPRLLGRTLNLLFSLSN
jgi:DNA-binding NarL/FixJ family response regulator